MTTLTTIPVELRYHIYDYLELTAKGKLRETSKTIFEELHKHFQIPRPYVFFENIKNRWKVGFTRQVNKLPSQLHFAVQLVGSRNGSLVLLGVTGMTAGLICFIAPNFVGHPITFRIFSGSGLMIPTLATRYNREIAATTIGHRVGSIEWIQRVTGRLAGAYQVTKTAFFWTSDMLIPKIKRTVQSIFG